MSVQRPHYLTRDPFWFLPLTALAANIALVGLLLVQAQSAKSTMRISVARPGIAVRASTALPVVTLDADGAVRVEGQTMATPLDLEFSLGALAERKGTAVILRTDPKADAAAVTRLLQACSEAGFADALIETDESKR